ncbi:MAG: methyltransferase domain-containing protein [Phycisphaerales bacterium]|nr:MAG: methyltransferase domain-containing protein [Phycisphaerales bacterium]
MPPGMAPTPVAPVQGTRAELLRRFVQAYWLRPENALWMTLRSEILSDTPLEHPSIDLACGDGVFSFLHCGGIFDPTFDVFTSIAEFDRAGDEHADMFDCVTDDYQPVIVSPSLDTIDVGTDIKRNMLAKARLLNLYGRLVEHDNNRPLLFDDDSFQTVYCNAAYWVANVDRFLTEMARITRPDGRVILQVKLDGMRRYTLGAHRGILGDRLLDIIDRGRSASWPTIADQATWEARFAASGLRVNAMRPFITRTHAHIWDIGLRPIAPLLAKMAQALAPKTRAAIKRQWVDLFCELLEPLCDPDVDLFAAKNEPAEVQYVLRPA